MSDKLTNVNQSKVDTAFYNIGKLLWDFPINKFTKKLCELGISSKNKNGEYKSTYELLREASSVYNTLKANSDNEKTS